MNESNSHFNSCEASAWSQVNSVNMLFLVFVVDMNYSVLAKHTQLYTNFSAVTAYMLHT